MYASSGPQVFAEGNLLLRVPGTIGSPNRSENRSISAGSSAYINQRSHPDRLPLPQRLTLRRRHVPGPVLNVVQLPDPLQNLVRLPRRIRPRVVELPPRVRPAGHLHDRPVRAQEDPVVASVGVGLEETVVIGEERRRTVTSPAHREVVDGVRVLGIADIGPESTLGTAGIRSPEHDHM